ncbi:MAG: hypothetical protein JXB47_06255 [Anaerolineae bacterium]|nr:hypothetical protein [Anaerolineae bacterium]
MPDTNRQAGCTIVMLGDSMTWGQSVNDEDTWVNLAAHALPDVHIVNAGVGAYNSANIRRSMPLFDDADAIVYLITYNDADAAIDFLHMGDRAYPSLWILRYAGYASYRAGLPPEGAPLATEDKERFFEDLDALAADPRVTFVGFAGFALLDEVKARYPETILIEPYTNSVSYIDSHPNAAGHRQIAQNLLPHLEHIREARCPNQPTPTPTPTTN